MTIEQEMKVWNERANDVFGKTLDSINKKAFADWFVENENGIARTPISDYITAYALDGNRKYTAEKVLAVIEDYDVMEDVKALAVKLRKLAA